MDMERNPKERERILAVFPKREETGLPFELLVVEPNGTETKKCNFEPLEAETKFFCCGTKGNGNKNNFCQRNRKEGESRLYFSEEPKGTGTPIWNREPLFYSVPFHAHLWQSTV